MSSRIATFTLGGRDVEVVAAPLTTLQSVLRAQLGRTSVKEGCRQGGCGSCTVLLDGEPVLSCLLPLEEVEGRSVTTVEDVGTADALSPLQAAFIARGGFQCGYCTPGMVMTATALLAHDPAPSRATIEHALSGNVCRCTGYAPIVAAIEDAADASASVEEDAR